jgi:hypothetical protein
MATSHPILITPGELPPDNKIYNITKHLETWKTWKIFKLFSVILPKGYLIKLSKTQRDVACPRSHLATMW